MLPRSRFSVGNILWLPQERDLPRRPFHFRTKLPQSCYGHPVILISIDSSDNAVWVLILTTFGGHGPTPAKFIRRGHNPDEYLPIYPAAPHLDDILSLLLEDGQSLLRDSWVFVRKPYRCAKAWLQELPPETWNMPWLKGQVKNLVTPEEDRPDASDGIGLEWSGSELKSTPSS
ncbi:hypothetical protein AOQ84DRAFT_228357 [Glonium stellatum]|uniref:Uncharacterized protein n=1 Tax=Glonium stellatum TaxID=574774 RepID=A0A8E2JMT7_9PEZI|nr:hypothetical protein AOQ84DRAFT_228357 [Glonium stellatum]